MPIIIQYGIAILGAVIVFANSLNINPQQFSVLSHRETKSQIVFYCTNSKTKIKDDTVVNINKDSGKVKISFKNKRDNIEFNLEYDNTISPTDREQIGEIMTNLKEYTKRNKSISGRVRHIIKDFINRKL